MMSMLFLTLSIQLAQSWDIPPRSPQQPPLLLDLEYNYNTPKQNLRLQLLSNDFPRDFIEEITDDLTVIIQVHPLLSTLQLEDLGTCGDGVVPGVLKANIIEKDIVVYATKGTENSAICAVDRTTGTLVAGVIQLPNLNKARFKEKLMELIGLKHYPMNPSPRRLNSYILDPEFQVSSEVLVDTVNTKPQVVALTNGGFVVVWLKYQSFWKLFARLYGSNSDETEFRVDSHSESISDAFTLAPTKDGGFILVWSYLFSGGYYIKGKIFDSVGDSSTGEFSILSDSYEKQHISVAQLSDENFILLWQGKSADTINDNVLGQILDLQGDLIGTHFIVSSIEAADQRRPQVLALKNGGFIGVWGNLHSTGNYEVLGKVFSNSGESSGANIIICEFWEEEMGTIKLAELNDKKISVVWDSVENENGNSGIYGQLLDQSYKVFQDATQINNPSTEAEMSPDQVSFGEYGFFVVWTQGTELKQIYGKRFNPDGSPSETNDRLMHASDNTERTYPGIAKIDESVVVLVFTSSDSIIGNRINICIMAHCESCPNLANVCEVCAEGYYSSGNNCINCHYLCKTCIGIDSSQCTSCENDNITPPNDGGYCECPQRKYQVNEDPIECADCTSNCLECNASDCLTCADSYIPVGPNCCDSLCHECSTTNPTHCSVCIDNASKDQPNENYSPCQCNERFSKETTESGTRCASHPLEYLFDEMKSVYSSDSVELTVGCEGVNKPNFVRYMGYHFKNGCMQLLPNSDNPNGFALGRTHTVYGYMNMDLDSPGTVFARVKTSTNSIRRLVDSAGDISLHIDADGYLVLDVLCIDSSQSADVDIVLKSTNTVPTRQWLKLGYVIEYNLVTDKTVISLVMDGIVEATKTTASAYYQDSGDQHTFLGSVAGEGGVTGFIATLTVRDGETDQGIYETDDLCMDPDKQNCIVTCEFTQTFHNGNCENCLDQCDTCIRPTDCVFNNDPLCGTFTTYTQCSVCALLAMHGSDGVCTCVSNASYSPESNECTCDDPYIAEGNACVVCRDYFRADEVRSGLNSKTSELTITFSESVKDRKTDCDVLFDFQTVRLFGVNPVCWWDNEQTLVVELGAEYILHSHYIHLNAHLFYKISEECTSTTEFLVQQVLDDSPPPELLVTIRGNSVYSLQCAQYNMTIYVLVKESLSADYKWELEGNNATLLKDTVESETSSRLSIDPSLLTEGILTFKITVTSVYAIQSVNEFKVTVMDNAALSVSIDAGAEVTMKSSEGRVFQAVVDEFCGDQLPTYEWLYEGAQRRSLSADDITSKATGSKLRIHPADLAPGTYTFKVVVTQGDAIGSSSIILTIEPTALSVSVSSSYQSTVTSNNLVIEATVMDPDEPEVLPVLLWLCIYSDATVCKGSDNEELISGETSSSLTINEGDLALGIPMEFTLVASKDNRTAGDSVTLELTNTGVIDLGMYEYSELVDSRRPFTYYLPKLDWIHSINWKKVRGSNVVPSTPLNSPYLSFSPNTLQAETYGFQATLQNSAGKKYAMTVFWTVAVAPDCLEELNYEQYNDYYEIWFSDCYDNDASVLPLYYSLRVRTEDSYRRLTNDRLSTRFRVPNIPGILQLTGDVCNSAGACSESFEITLDNTLRELEGASVSEMFTSYVRNKEETPMVASVLAAALALSESEWDLIFSGVEDYASNELEVSEVSAVIGAMSVLTHQAVLDEQRAVESADFLLRTLEKLNEKLLEQDEILLVNTIDSILGKFPNYGPLVLSSSSVLNQLMTVQMDGTPPYNEAASRTAENISLFKEQLRGADLAGRTYELRGVTAAFPETLPLDAFSIVSVSMTVLAGNAVDLSFGALGTYSDLELLLEPESRLLLTHLDSPLVLTLPCNSTEPECAVYGEKWDTKACSVLTNTEGKCTLEVTSSGLIAFTSNLTGIELIETVSCSLNYGPIIVIGIAALVSGILSLIVPRRQKVLPPTPIDIGLYDINFTGNTQNSIHIKSLSDSKQDIQNIIIDIPDVEAINEVPEEDKENLEEDNPEQSKIVHVPETIEMQATRRNCVGRFAGSHLTLNLQWTWDPMSPIRLLSAWALSLAIMGVILDVTEDTSGKETLILETYLMLSIFSAGGLLIYHLAVIILQYLERLSRVFRFLNWCLIGFLLISSIVLVVYYSLLFCEVWSGGIVLGGLSGILIDTLLTQSAISIVSLMVS